MDRGIPGFQYTTITVGPTTYRPGVAGAGPAVLLLHGFPQTHFCWHRVAPVLAARRTVVVCDIKGYGESRSAPGGPRGEGYGKREMAAELVELMARLGFARFAVVGHDRGGRVAYRMALDRPDAVERLAVLNIVPTVEQFERMAADVALDYYPWLLLAQPQPFAERLLAPAAEHLLRHTLESWTAVPGAIAAEATERYVRAFTPAALAGICADYRAAFHIDRPTDAADRRAGRRIGCPVLVHWGAEEDAMSDGPLRVWRRWADDVRGGPLRSGHFVPEEAAAPLLVSLRAFLAEPARPAGAAGRLVIRPEVARDVDDVRAMLRRAFPAGGGEAELVDRLRADGEHVPDLCLVARADGALIGMVFFSRARLPSGDAVLALAPMAVDPDRQRSGVGSRLLGEALRRAAGTGFPLVVVLGHPGFYGRFGFEPAGPHGVRAPWDVPPEAWMLLRLGDGRPWTGGVVTYPAAFDAVTDSM